MAVRKKQYVVFGLGRFGMSVAKTLSDKGLDVLAIDNNIEMVQEASKFCTRAVKADVTDENALRALGVSSFDVGVVAIGSNLESSVMVTILAKELGVKHVVAKTQDVTRKKVLEKIGADKVIFPEREMGVRIANSLVYGDFFEFMDLTDDFAIAEFKPPAEWIGKNLVEADVRARHNLNVIAIKYEDHVEVTPSADRKFLKEDIVVVIGQSDSLRLFLDKKIGSEE